MRDTVRYVYALAAFVFMLFVKIFHRNIQLLHIIESLIFTMLSLMAYKSGRGRWLERLPSGFPVF